MTMHDRKEGNHHRSGGGRRCGRRARNPVRRRGSGTHDIWFFPGIQTGPEWNVTVNCVQEVNSPSENETY